MRKGGFGGMLLDECGFSLGAKLTREDLQVYYFNIRKVRVNWFLMQFLKKRAVNVMTPLPTLCFYLWLPLMIMQLLLEAAGPCQA